MRYILILLAISFSTATFGQMPLKSRIYKTGVDTEGNSLYMRYEASKQKVMENLANPALDFADKCKRGEKTIPAKAAIPAKPAVQAKAAVYNNGTLVTAAQPGIAAAPAKPAVVSRQEKCIEVSSEIPQGFGGLSLGSFGGGTEATATLLQYNIHYSTLGYIPIYFLASTPIAEDVTNESINHSLLGSNTGLLNIKLSDDFYTFFKEKNSGKGEWICDFSGEEINPNLQGGCYINTQVGLKLVEYRDENNKSKQLGAVYTSIQFSFDFPISQLVEGKFSKAGRLVGGLGFSGYYANTDDIVHLFPELHDTNGVQVSDLDKLYASFDMGMNFTIDEEFSLEASVSVPLVNDDIFDTVTSIRFTWAPK